MDNRKRKATVIQPAKEYSKQWYMHQYIGRWAANLDRLPDAAAVRKDKQQSAPLCLVDMIF